MPLFDTLNYARRMKDAGFNDVQAEALADVTRDMVMHSLVTEAFLVAALDRFLHRLTVRVAVIAVIAVAALVGILKG
jgi:hypothetical protein